MSPEGGDKGLFHHTQPLFTFLSVSENIFLLAVFMIYISVIPFKMDPLLISVLFLYPL